MGECARVLGAIGAMDRSLTTGELGATDCVDRVGVGMGEGLLRRLIMRRAAVIKRVKKRASVRTGVDRDVKIQLPRNAKQRVNGNDEVSWYVTQG